ncbi:MAG: FAD-dependent monooxygenase [Bacteroidales bacterium]|nr:FAD-dependent monooxygenase [Bacteroidales bacterium]
MLKQVTLRTKPQIAADELKLAIEASTALDIDVNRIKKLQILKRSIDARQRQVMINLTLQVHIDEIDPEAGKPQPIEYQPLPADAKTAIVVGAGPAGLFAALRLIELGIRPIVLERGKDVDSRRTDLARISREGVVDADSNYCFGEGGAGAYSDGKLYTRSKKRGSVDKILNVLVQHGASADILVDAHPHIGSDKLPAIIRAMRETIIACGGEVHFGERVKELILSPEHRAEGVITASGQEYRGPVILATGHSARDVYRMLSAQQVKMEPKGIAVGVRVEHPQELIDQIFYHSPQGRGKYLPPAEYSLLTRVDERAVYSFCMCPGGYIIPATSEPGLMVVNGMSPANRGTQWANSGMVVEILPDDIPGTDPLKMMKFQEGIERTFFRDSEDGTQNAPAQRMTDFVAGKDSADLPRSSYTAGIHPGRLDHLLPMGVAKKLRAGLCEFGRKYPGYLCDEAIVVGDETRTSAPVRVSRDPATLSHVEVEGLYPAGEGAGYAGGIVSAAIDGERCAQALAENFTF